MISRIVGELCIISILKKTLYNSFYQVISISSLFYSMIFKLKEKKLTEISILFTVEFMYLNNGLSLLINLNLLLSFKKLSN